MSRNIKFFSIVFVLVNLFFSCDLLDSLFSSNVQPIASAGENQTVNIGDTVYLNGEKSRDDDGDLLNYSWEFTSKPEYSNAVLLNPENEETSFIADKAGDYKIELIVNDGDLYSNPSEVQIEAFDDIEKVATPVFDLEPGIYSQDIDVGITCDTTGVSIYYTRDGTNPNSSSSLFSESISISGDNTEVVIKAIAVLEGMANSDIAEVTYSINYNKVSTVSFSIPEGTYTTVQNLILSCLTPGAVIKYTNDSSLPNSTNGIIYNGAIDLPLDSIVNIKAIAYKAGSEDSVVSSRTYTITGTVSSPTSTLLAGTYSTEQNLTLTSSTPGAIIRYTNDGSSPSSIHGILYADSINIPIDTDLNLKAIAYKEAWLDSEVFSAYYIVLGRIATPAFNPAPGSFDTAQIVTLTSSTPGAEIYYTTDGADPSASSNLYEEALEVAFTTNIKAIAIKEGMTESEIASATYTINEPTISSSVIDPDGNTGWFTSIDIDNTNKVHISYIRKNPDGSEKPYTLMYSDNLSGFWRTRSIYNVSDLSYTSLAIDSSDTGYIAFKASDSIIYVTSNYSFVDLDLRFDAVHGPSMSILPDDSVLIMSPTYDEGSFSLNFYMELFNDDNHSIVGESSEILPVFSRFTAPSVVGTGEGKSYFSYYDERTFTLYNYSCEADSILWYWRSYNTLYESTNIYTHPAVTYSNRYIALNSQGELLSIIDDVPTDIRSKIRRFSSLAIDSNDSLHVSYFDGDNFQLRYATNRSGIWKDYLLEESDLSGNLTSILLEDTSRFTTSLSNSYPGYIGEYNCIAVDSEDNIHISYFDRGNGDLRYSYVEY